MKPILQLKDSKEISHHENGRIRVRTINHEPSKSDQTQKDSTDVNLLMKKYNNKMANVPSPALGKYADVSAVPQFQDALNQVIEAQNSFDSLPALVRKKFQNSPEEMIHFLSDPSNNEEAQKLGLKTKPVITTQPANDNANQNATTKAEKVQKTKTVSDD